MAGSLFHLYVDSADLAELEAVLPNPLIHGVTTNPTLMRRAGLGREGLPAFVERVLGLGVEAVQVQVESADASEIIRDARASVGAASPGRIVAKIPATRAGFAAGSRLSEEGIPITYTAVFEPEQVLFAAMAGAAYAAPYLGRLGDRGRDGLAVIAAMQRVLVTYGGHTRLLVASVRSRAAFLSLLDIGVGAVTVPASLLAELVDQPETIEAEREFLADAKAPQ